MKIKKRIFSLALAGALTMGLLPAFSSPALAADGDTSYTLTIPSTLTVADKGWNATDGISATGSLASGKKLTVTASSVNNWALKSGDNSVGYKLATASTDTEATTSWEFDTLSSTATTKTMGIIVDDYSTNPAGAYQDTVTFTASVEDAAPATITVTINRSDWDESITKDGVTVSAEGIDPNDYNLFGPGTFSTTLGNFTKIVVTAGNCEFSTGWSDGTWTGTPASTVSFDGVFMFVTTIVCTIQPTN